MLFVIEYHLLVPNVKKKHILMSKWQSQPLLREIFQDSPLLSYRKGRSLSKALKVNVFLA